MATTKYNIGDVLMVPFIVNAVQIDNEGIKYRLDIDKKFASSFYRGEFPHMVVNEDEFGKVIQAKVEEIF